MSGLSYKDHAGQQDSKSIKKGPHLGAFLIALSAAYATHQPWQLAGRYLAAIVPLQAQVN